MMVRDVTVEVTFDKILKMKEKEGRSVFIGFIFHEIRNPINALILTMEGMNYYFGTFMNIFSP